MSSTNNNSISQEKLIKYILRSALGIIIIMIFGSAYLMYQAHQSVPSPRIIPTPGSMPIRHVVINDPIPSGDSLLYNRIEYDEKIIAQLTARIDTLAYSNAILMYHNENLINDLRQETNNNIDKMNAWLTFWVATAGILAIILPIIVQIQFNRNERAKIKDEQKQLVEGIDGIKKGFDDDILKAKELVDQSRKDALMWENLTNLRIGLDTKVLIPISNPAHPLTTDMWDEIMNVFEKRIRDIAKNEIITKKDRDRLQRLLIPIMGYLMEFKRHVSQPHRLRSIMAANDQAVLIFNNLKELNFGSSSLLNKKLEKLISNLRNILC